MSSNTIAQGDTREGGLFPIVQKSEINFAKRNVDWPGVAAVQVTLLSIFKGSFSFKKVLNGRWVENINSFLDNDFEYSKPLKLVSNEDLSFKGSMISGKGFVLSKKEEETFKRESPREEEVLYPMLNGDDFNSNWDQKPSRMVINFKEYPLNKEWDIENNRRVKGPPYAEKYPRAINHLSETVKLERVNSEKRLQERWWQFGRPTSKLYNKLESLNRYIVTGQTSKYVTMAFFKPGIVVSNMCIVFPLDSTIDYSILSSNFHQDWVWKNCSTMGSSTIRYSPSDAFETFPFPDNRISKLRSIGDNFLNFRKGTLEKIKLGFTKMYNQFHNKKLIGSVHLVDSKEFEKTYGKETWNLYNHLEVKKEGSISYDEAVPLLFKLRELHKEMDEVVLAAYGWEDINLRHDFYEVEYLPENDRVRYTIHPDARKEVLKRLLLLNHERFEEEVAKGLHKKKVVTEYYKQKNKPIPEGTVFSDGKVKKLKPRKVKVAKAAEPKEQYGLDLFDDVTVEIKEGSKITIKKEDGTEFKYHIFKKAVKGTFTGEFKQISTFSNLTEVMLGRKAGDTFVFGGVKYEVLKVE